MRMTSMSTGTTATGTAHTTMVRRLINNTKKLMFDFFFKKFSAINRGIYNNFIRFIESL
jgi:phage-related protein